MQTVRELPAPPEPGPTAPRWAAPAATGALLAGGCTAILLVDPADGGAPVCASQLLFGLDCPMCGGLRCVNAMLRGDVLAAADHNVLLAVALPVAAAVWVVWTVASMRGRALRWPRLPLWSPIVAGVLVAAFTVARNVDAGGWVGWLASTAGA